MSLTTSSGSGSPRRRISWKNSRQLAVSSLLPGAGAVLNMMQPTAEQSIAVYGVGGVGLAGLMAERIAGCDPIIAVDRLPSRLVLPRELGATHTLGSCGP
jgi:Zn-dependent alcohol dehydrogenase